MPAVAPREAGPRSLHELIAALADIVPFALLIGGTLGSIYAGVATPTEAAASAAAWRSFCAAVRRTDAGGLVDAMHSTIRLSAISCSSSTRPTSTPMRSASPA